jgi:hypothetical protein
MDLIVTFEPILFENYPDTYSDHKIYIQEYFNRPIGLLEETDR